MCDGGQGGEGARERCPPGRDGRIFCAADGHSASVLFFLREVRVRGREAELRAVHMVDCKQSWEGKSMKQSVLTDEMGASKADSLHVTDKVKMGIVAQDGETMLASERGNPGIIGRNWRGRVLQLLPKLCIMISRFPGDFQNLPLPR